MTTISLKNLVKKYGDLEVVHSINLDIKDAEFIVLVGPSGCGKSTTLRMIAGLEEITSGEIVIGDRVVNNILPKDRNIAMVFQSYALYPHMNVFDNMSFSLKLRKVPKAEIKERVKNAARILNIEDLLQRRPSALSGGQRQRVAMGRAIVRNPDIFLFDEPLSNLDAKLRTQMRVEIKELHQRVKNTIVYVTHDQVEAMTLGDRIVVLKDGYIEQVGDPIELFQKPVNTFVAGFIGAPPMNLIDGTIAKKGEQLNISFPDGFNLPIPDKPYAKISEGQNVVMGLRPEDIYLAEGGNNIPDEWKFEAQIVVTEPLGSETYMHLDVKGLKITGKCEGRRAVHPNEKIKLAFNLNHLHIFDAASTKSIY
ncbi:MAG: sn-glycerol-3-phosphate ABC transporter ATP-binding protein UgpC [Desulfobacterales bacterium]|nr:sn-glycerol-3-phosphate ABC transporter ATP-binding protein UgpC [Desulfobacterales bacterium]